MATSTVRAVDGCVDFTLTNDRDLVAEVGSHKQLMALKGRYYCLYQQQDTQVS
jgi:ABC-type multidrug transport system fused ATPase/permease subunit